MNDNKTFSTTTTAINEDYMLFPYNDHYSSQQLLPFSPLSSINDILIHSNSNTSNNHLDHHHHHHHHHHHQYVQAPSPFSHFESAPDFALLASFLPQNNGHNDDQTVTTSEDHHLPSLLPLNKPIGESHLTEASETITTHREDSQRISASQDPNIKIVKKPRRTDRHSKIKTAKGTRDRRMRLSLDVAKELFGLQDMLGFDKASKTVEWLLTQAKPEIIKIANSLSNQFNHGRYSSCEESQTRSALGLMDTSCDLCQLASIWTVQDRGSNTNTTEKRGNKVDGTLVRGKRRMSQPRTPILKKLSKDARVKARERAKDRTKEKMMKKSAQVNVVVEEEVHNHHDETVLKNNKSNVKATPWEEKIQELLCKNDGFAVCNEFVVDKKDYISDEFISSFPVLDHHRSQWAVSSIEQQRQFADLHHFLGKPRPRVHLP